MRRLPAVVCAALGSFLAGCYDQLPSPPLYEAEPSVEVTPTPERPVQPSAAGSGELAENLTALGRVIDRLGRGSAQQDVESRPGAMEWRAKELEKLNEVVTSICAAGSAGCKDGLSRLVGAELPPAELRSTLALFMGPLRPLAETGFSVLGGPILSSKDAKSRDLAYRIAVGAGVTRRGEPDENNLRVALVPQTPRPGVPVVIVVELPSPCPQVRTEHKGPDVNGRVDIRIAPNCSDAEEPKLGPEGFPQPARAVWGMRIPELPEAGISVWAYGAEAPLLEYRPAPPPGKTPSESPREPTEER